MLAEACNYVSTNVTSSPVFDIVNEGISTLLYHPQAFFVTLVAIAYTLITNTPPFVTFVLLPLFLVHRVYRIVRWVLREYQVFLDLGKGGTPTTPSGWVLATLRRFWANVDVFDPPHIDPMLEPYRGQLFGIPRRRGLRPVVKGVAPPRQTDQKTPKNTFDKLLKMIKDKAAAHPNLTVQTSYFERHTDALKAIFPDRPRQVNGTESEWDFELCHPQRIDGSIHMIMHPEDVKTIIENGWGERHPLATKAWYWTFYHHYIRGRRCPVPYNLVLVYAPRTKLEFEMVDKFLDAVIWFAHEKDICDKVRDGLMVRAPCGTPFERDEALASGKFVVGPEGKLLNHEKAIETGLWTWSPCGSKLVPVDKKGGRPRQKVDRHNQCG